MISHGEIPGGCNRLQPLLYPFHRLYPLKILSKYRWFRNSRIQSLLPSLDKRKKWLTVIDRLGAPGDALITANVIRCIKEKYSNLKINCITPHPELIRLDPCIDSINDKESFYSFDSSYWELIVRKETRQNIIAHNLSRLDVDEYEYQAKFHLSEEEKNWAKQHMGDLPKPIIAICTQSKEVVKNWPLQNWIELINSISPDFSIIQLGDEKEPVLENVICYAGKHTMRESAALLSRATLFIGPDSLLMHVANGLNISSVIIFGGSRPVSCFGYEKNINLGSLPSCSPCWIHQGYESCKEDLKCMHEISVNKVISSINMIMKKSHEQHTKFA